MNCRTIREKLDLYAGGDLDGREITVVEVHLRTCLSCYRDYTELRDLLTTVRATRESELRGEAATESLVAGVMSEIHGPPPAAPQWLPRLTLVSGWAAAITLAVTLGWQVVRPPASSHSRSQPTVIEHGPSSGDLTPAWTINDEIGRQLDELPTRTRGRRVVVPSTVVQPGVRPKHF